MKIKLKSRRIVAFLVVIVLAIGGYVGWQIYQGQQQAHQYETNSLKMAQGSSSDPASANLPLPSTSPSQTSPAPASLSNASSNASSSTVPQTTNPGLSVFSGPLKFPGFSESPVTPISPGPRISSESSESPESQPTSNPPTTPSRTYSSVEYKQLMSSTCQQTLQTMLNVRSSTLALQGHKMSLSAYRASILQSQAAFSSAEDFVRANPPSEANLNSSYQELLAGVDLAKRSMDVVLNGISSFSPSSLYAAREMGKQAQQQVSEGYGGL